MSLLVSKDALAIIADHEGFSHTPYDDGAGFMTIGYGHKIKDGEHYTYLTREQAWELLKQDASSAEQAIHDLVKVELSQNQFNALVSFVFNVGRGNFGASTLLKKINSRDFIGAVQEFAKWKYAGGRILPGLVKRREKEAALFSRGL